MKLTNHRRDVEFLKKLGENRLSLRPIAERYQRLILMAEVQFKYLKEFNQEPLEETMWPQERRVLKDAKE